MVVRNPLIVIVVAVIAMAGAACASGSRRGVPPGTVRPDQYLYDRGMAELKEENWITAREFLRQVYETYVQSPLRPEAKISIGDTYFGEGSAAALALAINEFQEFLTYYPTNPRADYAQYKLGMCHFRQMRNPDRDQTETNSAIKEFETFVTRYPNSSLLPEVKAKLRESRDRLSESDFRVGVFYYRIRWFPGALDRLTNLIKQDPEFSGRDGVYFYLGEALVRLRREAEALPYYEKIVAEFEVSEHLEDAKKRIEELKAQALAKQPS
jgi:outer membrane protein assembly factor BamD